MADLIAKIKLADGSELPVGKHFITSVESVSQSTPDAGSVNYGTIANSGSMEIQDGNGYISDLIDDGLLPISDLDVKLEVDGNVIQEHITTDSDYDTEDNNLSISLSNFIKDFDILKYKGYAYPETSKKLYDLFYDVLYSYYYTQYPSETYPTFIDNMFESSVLTYIKAIEIKYPVIEYGNTYREILNDLCTIAQLNMFADANNKPKFVSARPVYTAFDEVKELKWKNIVDSLKYTRLLKNKFDGVEMNKTQVVDTIRFNDVVFTSDDIDSTSISPVMGVTAFNSDDSGGRSYDLKTMPLPAMSAISVVRVKNYYIEGSVSFNKKNSNNTEQINNVSNNAFNTDDSPRFEIHYDIKGDEPITGKIDASTGLATQLTIDNTFKREGSGYLSQIFSYEYQNTRLTDTITAIATVNAKDQSSYTVSYDSLNKKYTINFKILCGQDLVYLGGGVDRDVDTAVDKIIDCTGKNIRYMPKYIKFSVYGDKRIITFTETSASTEGIENCKTKASVSSSNLLQNTATYDNKEIAEVIKENILNDYRNGIADATMSLNADITDIGKLVKYPEDNRVWKVVEKDFRYDGDYNYPLKLMQCVRKLSKYGAFDENDDLIYTWEELIDGGFISISNGVITNYSYNDKNNKLVFNNDITEIGENAFENNTKLIDIILNNGVTTIGASAFSGCVSLTEILIPSSVTTIGASAFSGCVGLSCLWFEDRNDIEISVDSTSFEGCSNIAMIYYNGTSSSYNSYIATIIQNISSDYKYGSEITAIIQSDLTSETSNYKLNGTLTSVGKALYIPDTWRYDDKPITGFAGAFASNDYVSRIVKLVVGKNITSFIDDAFNGFTALTEIIYRTISANDLTSSSAKVFYKAGINSTGITLYITDGVIKIPSHLFHGLQSSDIRLVNIYIPKSIKTIGNQAFNCSYIQNPYYYGTLDEWASINFNSSSSGSATSNPINYAHKLYLTNGLTFAPVTDIVLNVPIKDYAFIYLQSATSLKLKSGVTSIGNFAFAYANNLTGSLIIPNTVTSIGQYAFRSCSGFTGLVLSNNLRIIDEGSFYYCLEFSEKLIIPNNVTTIRRNAFGRCDNLIDVEFENPNGWTVDGASVDLSDDSTNATLLKSTYVDKEWTKS